MQTLSGNFNEFNMNINRHFLMGRSQGTPRLISKFYQIFPISTKITDKDVDSQALQMRMFLI